MSYVGIMDRYTGGEWRVNVAHYEAIMHAWETDAPRVEFTTCDGTVVALRVADIVSVNYVSDEAEANVKARLDRDRLESA